MNTQDFGTRPSVTFRPSATANLMIDSEDRNTTLYASPFQFQIQKSQSLLNGFFTRIATTEVNLDWCEPNVSIGLKNNTAAFDLSGSGANTYNNTVTITLNDNNYTVAQITKVIASLLNDLSGTTGIGVAQPVAGSINPGAYLVATGGAIIPNPASKLNQQLDWKQVFLNVIVPSICADLRPYRYIDFVSNDLTYTQYLKDSSTQNTPRDVVCRWYFAEDNQETLDEFGYPIFQGYAPFCRRRIFNPPKYIRWDSNLPIGSISFNVYDPQGAQLTWDGFTDTSWLMTLQVSEN